MKLYSMKALAAISVLSYVSGSAAAAVHYGNGVPTNIAVKSSGIVSVFFVANTQISGASPACANYNGSGNLRVVFDSTTPGGKSMLALLLSAHGIGQPIWYFGSGDCNLDNANESLSEVDLN